MMTEEQFAMCVDVVTEAMRDEMRATLVFDLTDEREEFEHAVRGSVYLRLLENLANAFRSKVKYTDEQGSWRSAHELFWETVKASGVELD